MNATYITHYHNGNLKFLTLYLFYFAWHALLWSKLPQLQPHKWKMGNYVPWAVWRFLYAFCMPFAFGSILQNVEIWILNRKSGKSDSSKLTAVHRLAVIPDIFGEKKCPVVFVLFHMDCLRVMLEQSFVWAEFCFSFPNSFLTWLFHSSSTSSWESNASLLPTSLFMALPFWPLWIVCWQFEFFAC